MVEIVAITATSTLLGKCFDIIKEENETASKERIQKINMEDKAKEREHQLKMMKEKCDSDLQMKKYDMESEKMKQDLERELQRMNDESEREKRQMQNEQLKIIGNETDKTNKMMLDMKKQSDAADQRAQKEDNEMYEKNRQEMLRMNEESRKEHERAMEAEKKTIARIEQETKDERERSEKEYKERQKHLEKRENEMKQLHQQQIDEMNEKYKEAEKRRDEHGDAMIAILDTECEKMMEIQEKQKESFEKIMQNSERNHKEKMAILNKQLENVQQTHDKIAEEYRVKRKYLENQKAALDELKQIIVKREIGFVSGLRKTVDDHIANSQFDSRMDENKRTADRTLCYITDIKRINVKLEIITNEEMKKAELDTLSFTLTALNKHAELARMTAAEDMLSIGANLVDQDIVPIAKVINYESKTASRQIDSDTFRV
ncbi:hypothetical protein WR25_04527 isoform C [Diploscapter pachys]|uniref:Uncharacterized protein n=1 Tax=Diploscapter pachys TaxID=2018661 RepID=A0A2A2LFT2_9BILA|nr:hypothetical protein WR25_04527 isoform B [Diploscapter pachys]PAV85111.1 hypothetical protein WR25_04527 isoform C [Diploscapter pachys]